MQSSYLCCLVVFFAQIYQAVSLLVPRELTSTPQSGIIKRGAPSAQIRNSFAACNVIGGGLHFDISITIAPAPVAVSDTSSSAYRRSRFYAREFVRSLYAQIQAEARVNGDQHTIPPGWTIPPNNNFRMDLVREINTATGQPLLPIPYWILNQAICKLRSYLDGDPEQYITDGQIVIQFYLPTQSTRGSVCRANGLPVATLTITRTVGILAAGAGGPPGFISRLQSRVNALTRGQILFGDRFPGIDGYIQLPGGP